MAKDNRKRDTREKIALGGLIVKAGLRETNAAVILGMLIDSLTRAHDGEVLAHYRAIGQAAFKDKVGIDEL